MGIMSRLDLGIEPQYFLGLNEMGPLTTAIVHIR